ncbi:NlpC/P60 family protein [Solibacillus sp. FSL W8-0372]|uniref:NlpC/P60 family protein n=1 Tax=Solibacillus sp. FSL W8-0372 TaxID=2921713 RepID=UPI0030CCEE48
MLTQYHYEELLDEELQQGDVIIWKDDNDIIQHAAYYIGEGLYFNKHGQTMFNPWKILSEADLYKEWEHLRRMNYRQVLEK